MTSAAYFKTSLGLRPREKNGENIIGLSRGFTAGRAPLARSEPSGKLLRMPRTKSFKMAIADLPNMVDAIFAGNHDDPGWVEMNVNDRGRACVDALFPRGHIAWRKPGVGLPADWRGFNINVPDVVAEMETALPLDITRGHDLDEANPDALVLLLALGVTRQGGRAAYLHEGHIEIALPHSGH
jgi:hypothetical protein